MIRLVVAGVTGVLLAGGYLASVAAYFNQDAAGYADRISASPVPMLSLGLLVAVVIFALLPTQAAEDDLEVDDL
ncbi:MAG: hypothetical protein ACKVQS_14585 [Fimbriimonadaceae bacterium]